ncbi:hypothetical protein, partial [Pseudonocardia sp. NPDC049154]|uniref:hypothetical protein n=1 Tax=Pseudonocardia sp. NPDC049154 TaxID=3155501 RepID=UPI0033D002EE
AVPAGKLGWNWAMFAYHSWQRLSKLDAVHGGGLHRRPWRAHPDCHCGASPRAAPVPAPRIAPGKAPVAAGVRAGVTETSPTCAAEVGATCGPAARRETIMR